MNDGGTAAYTVRDAAHADGGEILALMPRLADFDVPESRNPDHLWMDDAKLLQRWLDGEERCIVCVAESASGAILGFALARLRPELLSHEPSAHLEAIATRRDAEGRGLARALLDAVESRAREAGAQSMTLHVFARNARARAFYERAGYDGELLRYIRRFDDDA